MNLGDLGKRKIGFDWVRFGILLALIGFVLGSYWVRIGFVLGSFSPSVQLDLFSWSFVLTALTFI